MDRNVEIKARLLDLGGVRRRVKQVASDGPFELVQDDTFFRCPTGRLKLREFSAESGELIIYQRPDRSGPEECYYIRSPTTLPAAMRESVTLAYGTAGRVRKKRTLYLVGRTRIHLDRVEGLGNFLELEVVLSDDESAADGVEEATSLLQRLEIQSTQ